MPRIADTALPSGTVGSAYQATLVAAGTTPMVWSQISGSLPTGLALGTDGTIQGTPTVAGSYDFTVKAENALGAASRTRTIAIAAVTVAPTITGPSLPLADATVGVAYSQTFTATGTTPMTWTIAAGALPSGLQIDSSTGVLSGTPLSATTAAFTVAATNGSGADTRACSLIVLALPTAPSITGPASPLPNGIVNVAYVATFTASGSAPITWSVTAGTLPTGLSLASSTGVLSGTPTAAEVRTFSVTATNNQGSDTASIQLTTGYAPSLSALSPASGVVGGTIELQGAGFAPTTGGNTVHFGGVVATVLTATTTALAVQVPAGLGSTASVTVTTSTTTTSGQTFTLDPTTVVFVDGGATGAADGSNWTDAFPTVQAALVAATSSDEVWIAAGTYRPGTATTDWFVVASRRLYGGFAGTEALRSQQDWLTNATVLDGDVNGDSAGGTNLTDNNEHVVMATGSCVLDGLRVTQGNSATSGGGIHASSGTMQLHHVEVFANHATGDGGGVFLADVIVSITDCTIRDNVSAASGGGIAIEHGTSISLGGLARVAIARNTAQFHGGGVYDTEYTSYNNAVFVDNAAGANGGGLYRSAQNVSATHVTFVGNAAANGGGFYGKGTLTNVLFWSNAATTAGSDVEMFGDLTLDHCLIANSPTGSGTLTQQNVLTGDPLLVAANDADGADDRFRTADDGLQPGLGSPAIDSGKATLIVEDVVGAARPVGSASDLGAYERQ